MNGSVVIGANATVLKNLGHSIAHSHHIFAAVSGSANVIGVVMPAVIGLIALGGVGVHYEYLGLVFGGVQLILKSGARPASAAIVSDDSFVTFRICPPRGRSM